MANPNPRLRRDDGYLWVVLPQGVHRVRVEGLLSDATEWEWTFLLKPRRVTIDAPGWNVSGVRPDGVPDQQIFFAQQQKATAGQASYDRQDYQSLVVVQRHIELGLIWQVRTTVSRLSPEGKAVALRVPLLPGENVLSANTVVKDGFIEVRLGAQDKAFVWESELTIAKELKLSTKARQIPVVAPVRRRFQPTRVHLIGRSRPRRRHPADRKSADQGRDGGGQEARRPSGSRARPRPRTRETKARFRFLAKSTMPNATATAKRLQNSAGERRRRLRPRDE